MEFAGRKTEVKPVTSEEYKTPAKRPKNSILSILQKLSSLQF